MIVLHFAAAYHIFSVFFQFLPLHLVVLMWLVVVVVVIVVVVVMIVVVVVVIVVVVVVIVVVQPQNLIMNLYQKLVQLLIHEHLDPFEAH